MCDITLYVYMCVCAHTHICNNNDIRKRVYKLESGRHVKHLRKGSWKGLEEGNEDTS